MKKRFTINIVIVIIVFSNLLLGQNESVAKVGNEIITRKEFVERFEMTPRVNDEYPKDSAKINFLYSIIAEKLWAKEGERKGLYESVYVKASVENITRKLLRDKLYKEEIEKKVSIKPKEISRDLAKVHKKLYLNFIFSPNRKEIFKIYRRLSSGVPFDSLLLKRKEFAEQRKGIPVYYADMNEHLETVVYALKKGEFTHPIKMGKGWVIYYLKGTEYVQTHPKFPNKKDEKLVKDVLFDRKAKKEYENFIIKFVKGKLVKSDKKLTEKLSDALCDELKRNLSKAFNPNDKKYYLNYYSVMRCKNVFSREELQKPLIKFKQSPVSLAYFIEQLSIDGFSVAKCGSAAIENSLRNYEKKFIFDKILERLAVRKGYGNAPDVKKDIKMWRESFIASFYRNSLLDSVSVNNSEINEYYERIKPLLPDSLIDKYDYVRKKLSSGLYFKKLKSLYEQKTAELAVKYGIQINRKVLDSVKVSNVEMLVYRYLGFGGKITAVPYAIPFYEWKSWLPKKLIDNRKM